MRCRKSWDDIDKTVSKVTNTKIIANEKLKQRRASQPNGTGFTAVQEYKKFLDERDANFVFVVSGNTQVVFKTPREKLMPAQDMDCFEKDISSTEYCHFDGKVGRAKDFRTLTASVYYPLLQKQVVLATTEFKREGAINIGIFWKEFNKAYKLLHKTEDKFNPVTDMLTANFTGLERFYGEEVLNKIKGCEFHYKKSVNKPSRQIVDDGESFKTLALELLLSFLALLRLIQLRTQS